MELFYSLKIKHKVKWMVKFAKTTSPSSHAHSLLSTTKHLGKIKLHMVFSLKNFFELTLTVLKNVQSFSYSLLPQTLKLARPSLRLVVLIKIVASFYFKVRS